MAFVKNLIDISRYIKPLWTKIFFSIILLPCLYVISFVISVLLAAEGLSAYITLTSIYHHTPLGEPGWEGFFAVGYAPYLAPFVDILLSIFITTYLSKPLEKKNKIFELFLIGIALFSLIVLVMILMLHLYHQV